MVLATQESYFLQSSKTEALHGPDRDVVGLTADVPLRAIPWKLASEYVALQEVRGSISFFCGSCKAKFVLGMLDDRLLCFKNGLTSLRYVCGL